MKSKKTQVYIPTRPDFHKCFSAEVISALRRLLPATVTNCRLDLVLCVYLLT